MNKNKKLAPINFGCLPNTLLRLAMNRLFGAQVAAFATGLLLSLLTFQQACAQGEFQFRYDAPVTSAPSSNNSFPEHPRFDPNIQPAELLVRGQVTDELQQVSHEESPEAVFGSAGEMIASMSTTFQKQWQEGQWQDKFKSYFHNFDVGRMLGSLALVLGGYFSLVWVSRHLGGNGKVPSEVLEVLGQVPFGPKKQLQIVRLGSKLLLLINSPEGTHPIGEITDPEEVEYLASLCQGRKTTNAASVLRIAKAATSEPSIPVAPATPAQPSVAAALANVAPLVAPAAAAAVNPASLATNPNHLAAILQALNGQSGNAAVFEA